MQQVARLVFCVALVWGGGVAQAIAETGKPLVRVGMMMFPGFSEIDEQGRIVGKTVRLTRRILEQAGYQADIRIMPAARIWRGLEGGQIHLWPGVLNKPGLDPLPSIPLAEQPMRFLLSKRSGFASSLRADLDLAYDQLVAAGEDLEVTRQ